MARSVLHKSRDGAYELVCDPENEAAIYAEALTLNLWPHASEFAGPIKLIGCDPSRASRAEGRGYLPELRPPEVWWPSFFTHTTSQALRIQRATVKLSLALPDILRRKCH